MQLQSQRKLFRWLFFATVPFECLSQTHHLGLGIMAEALAIDYDLAVAEGPSQEDPKIKAKAIPAKDQATKPKTKAPPVQNQIALAEPPDVSDKVCFLCNNSFYANFFEQGDMAWDEWMSHEFHHQCFLGVRCHNRLLPNKESKVADKKLLQENPQDWKDRILPLVCVDGSARSRALVADHADNVSAKAFAESYIDKGSLLLTKARFINFMAKEEGYVSESASESFERRLQESDSEHRNSSDEEQVRARKNPTIGSRTGQLATQELGAKKSDQRGSCRNRSGRSGRRRTRDQVSPRCKDAGDSRSRSARLIEEVSSIEYPSADEQPFPSRASGSGAGASSRQRRCSKKTTDKDRVRSRGRSRNYSRKDSFDETPKKKTKTANETTEYLSRVGKLATKVKEQLKKTTTKAFCTRRLETEVKELPVPLQKKLEKKGKSADVIQDVNDKVATLKSMADQVDEIDSGNIDNFESRLDECLKGLESAKLKVEEMLDGCAVLRKEASKDKRSGQQQKYHKKRKVAKVLTDGGWQKFFADGVGTQLIKQLYDPIDDNSNMVSWNVLTFNNESALGKSVIDTLDQYQTESSTTVVDKVKSLAKWLKNNKSKQGNLAQVPHGNGVTKLAIKMAAAGGHGDVQHDWIHDPGAGGWILGANRAQWREGPGESTVQGIGFYCKLCKDSPPMQLVLLPMQKVCDAGLVDFENIANFMEQKHGKELFKQGFVEHISIDSADMAMWIPYGYIVFPIANTWGEKKDPLVSYLWFLHVWNEGLANSVSDQVWASLMNYNTGAMAQLSGQKLWADRLEILTKLDAARKAIVAAPA